MRRVVLIFAVLVVATSVGVDGRSAFANSADSRGTSWQVGSDDSQDQVSVVGEAAGQVSVEPAHHGSGGWIFAGVQTGDRSCDPNNDGVADPIYLYVGPDGRFVEVCRDPTPPPPIPSAFAEETRDSMGLPSAGVELSPPENRNQLVNVATWMWVNNWAPVSTSATLRGVTVSVTATPDSVGWDMGAGDPPVVCGAGTPYNPSVPDEQQHTDCSYAYRRSSYGRTDERFHGAAVMHWTITWTSSTGESGTLPAISTTRAFALRVTEGEAVVTDAH